MSGEVVLSRYEVQRSLGKGKFSEVFLALDPLLERQVAIKQTHNATEALQEARIMATYGAHEFLLQVFDIRIEDQQAWVVLERASGHELGEARHCRRREPELAVRITMNILRALRHLHGHGYLHGDVQPRNVILEHDNHAGVKLIDLGSACRLNAHGVYEGPFRGGTWEYMPPEQFARSTIRLDESADLYAAAAICVCLILGSPPFLPATRFEGSEEKAECLRLHQQVPALHGIAIGLRKVLQTALQPNPGNRYRHAQALIDGLRPFSR